MGLTKQELIDRIYRKRGLPAGLTKRMVAEVVDAVFSELGDYFVKSRMGRNGSAPKFTYPGFGTFFKKKRSARAGRHPKTGQPIKIPAAQTLAFNVGSDLKSLLNSKK